MRILYVKSSILAPTRACEIVKAFPDGHVFSDRELATAGHDPLFGVWDRVCTNDEAALCNMGRRKVDDVTTPTALISVD